MTDFNQSNITSQINFLQRICTEQSMQSISNNRGTYKNDNIIKNTILQSSVWYPGLFYDLQ